MVFQLPKFGYFQPVFGILGLCMYVYNYIMCVYILYDIQYDLHTLE